MSVAGITRRELVRRGGLLALPAFFRGAGGRGRGLEPGRTRRGTRRPGARGSVRTSTSRSGCVPSSTPAAPTRSSPARRCCPRCARPWTRRRATTCTSTSWPRRSARGSPQLTGAEWGMVTSGLLGGPHPRDRGLRDRRQPRPARSHPRPARLPEGRVHHPEALAQRLRRGGPRGRRAVVEVSTAEELEAAFGPRTALVYILAGPNADEGPLEHAGRLRGREQAGACPCSWTRGRDPHRPERPPAARRRPRRLQRRQVPARPAGRRPPPRPQGPREGRVGGQRAPPRLRPRVQGRQGGGDGDAGGRRDVDEARLRGRDPRRGPRGSTRSRDASRADRRRHHLGHAGRGALEPHAVLQIRWDRAKLGTTGEAVAKLLFDSEPRISLFPARGKARGERDRPHASVPT